MGILETSILVPQVSPFQDSGVRHFHLASNYDGIKETVVSIDVDGEMVEAGTMDGYIWFMDIYVTIMDNL